MPSKDGYLIPRRQTDSCKMVAMDIPPCSHIKVGETSTQAREMINNPQSIISMMN